MKAKAVVFTERLQVTFMEVDVPEPSEDDVVIDVEHSWISIGTESSFLRCERIAGETPYREGDPRPFPQVAGYQKVGIVRSAGANVEGVKPGDRVFATVSGVNGMFFAHGGHVNPAVTHKSQVWLLPDGKPALDYSGLVLTQVGFNCGDRPPVKPGDLAVVIGDGLVGQWTAQTLLRRGAEVFVLGRHAERLRFLPQAAGMHAVHMRETSPAEALGGRRIDIVVDSVGTMDTFSELQPMMAHDSHLVSAGFLGEAGMVDIQRLRPQEITLHTPSGWTKPRMDKTLDGITEGWLQTAPLITHRVPAEMAEETWRTILESRQQCLGVVLDWEPEPGSNVKGVILRSFDPPTPRPTPT